MEEGVDNGPWLGWVRTSVPNGVDVRPGKREAATGGGRGAIVDAPCVLSLKNVKLSYCRHRGREFVRSHKFHHG